MNNADRLEWLRNEHSELDKQVQQLEKNYGEQDAITFLKKKKLKIKDEIQQLQKEIL